MPKYKIQLKQGKNTKTAHGEFKSQSHALAHYNLISTMKVAEISKIVYEDETTPPIDDYNYSSLYKSYIKNLDTRKSKQVIFHNLKNTASEQDIATSIKLNMEIDTSKVDSVVCALFKD